MRRPIVTTLLCAALFALADGAVAESKPGLYPHEKMNNWGRWGADDERGAQNFITAEAIVAAADLIRTGATFSLAIPLDGSGPVYPGRLPPHHTMTATGADYVVNPNFQPFGPTPIQFADDYIYMPLQGSSQWDGLPHAWYGGKLYNDTPESMIRSAPAGGGATKLGIENVKDGLVGRGVLIDVVRSKGGSLPPGYTITRADIEGALAKQKTEVRSGDIVLVRTGVVPEFYTLSDTVSRVKFLEAPQAGLASDVVPWVRDRELAAIAADNLALERIPNENDPAVLVPLHGNLLRDLGVYIGEIWWLEDLAEHCAGDGRYDFFLAAQPLNITGAVGSPVNPIAIK
jgi:kynurenine formamidase